MDLLLNFSKQYWGSVCLWLGILVTVGYVIISAIRELREEKKIALKNTGRYSVPASTSSTSMERHIPTKMMKTSTATKIILLLVIILPAIGYASRDFQLRHIQKVYQEEHSAWLQRQSEWQKSWNDWQIKHSQEKENARRLSTTSTARATDPATQRHNPTSESFAIRRIKLER